MAAQLITIVYTDGALKQLTGDAIKWDHEARTVEVYNRKRTVYVANADSVRNVEGVFDILR
jgi:hypothetical protein